ncbi:MAG TPA: RNA methyltransferase [Phenylobacterium sp.]|uniref:TrmH family RNA methyltransferase n=1 Tax=Phenylobacterium sp. TaxID=1871053 RepID=UPI002C289ABF|nr:RNA methyltransferase [Phenylobacterium sp.]HSV04644.1 RNA methyltransferase [Phenylobacterium sp.]
MIVAISHPDDPRIEDYRAVRERDLVGRGGGFIAEGLVVLEKLVAAGRHPLRSVLVASKRLEAIAGRLEALPDSTPIYAASQAVMDQIVGFPIHRGVLALGERAEPAAGDLLAALPERALVVGLSAIANHDNMGGLFRNAAAFGADAVLLDPGCCDPLYRKAIRVSVGAALTVPFARLPPAHDLLATLERAGFEVIALSPAGAETLEEVPGAPRQAALFGAEGPGLAAELLARARSVRIPMAHGFDSLNVATASGIVLHHLATVRNRA